MTPLVGQTLLNQFRVDAFIAAGGMGAIYRVWDLKRDVPLAMKVLHDDYAHDPALIRKFEGEARALEELSHPNIVRFYGIYQTQDMTFILQDFIDGASLKEILRKKRDKPLTLAEAFSYLWPICAALGYAHSKGIVHCDIKPGNVLINRAAKVYLADFGLARRTESLVATRDFGGTPAYMAPELIRGSPPTAQSDMFALGVILYEMLTGGKRPFSGKFNRWEEAYSNPTPTGTYNPHIPIGIEKIILRCLSADPRDRYASIEEMVADLNRIGVQYTDLQPSGESTPVQTMETVKREQAQPLSRDPLKGPRQIPVWLWLIFGGAAIFAVFIILLNRPVTTPPPLITSALPPIRSPNPTIIPRPTQTPTIQDVPLQPFTFEANSCMEINLDPTGDNRLAECVTLVRVSPHQTILINFSWTAYLKPDQEVEILHDTTSHNMYITDDFDQRYDHHQTGNDASRDVVLIDKHSANGWFLFPVLNEKASYFIFHDDDNQAQTEPILIQWP